MAGSAAALHSGARQVDRGTGIEPARAEAPRCYRPLPYRLGFPRLAEGGGIEPPGDRAPTAFEAAYQTKWPSFQERRACEAEGEGVEPPLASRPDRRVPSECLTARPTFLFGDPRKSGGSGNRTHAGMTRPRRSKPAPYHSAIPPIGLIGRCRASIQGTTSPPRRPEASPGSVALAAECGLPVLGYRDDDEDRLPNTYEYDELTYAMA